MGKMNGAEVNSAKFAGFCSPEWDQGQPLEQPAFMSQQPRPTPKLRPKKPMDSAARRRITGLP